MHVSWAGLLVAALVVAGCATAPQLRERVGGIHIEGNGSVWEGTGDFHVRQAMEQQKGVWSTPIFRKLAVPLDLDTLADDAWRIELWYAHNGYLDARFLGWDVEQRRPAGRRRAAVLDITGYVEQGEPSLVRELRFEGLKLGGGTVHERYIERNASIAAGDVFSIEAVDDTETLIRGWLQEHSYAWVTVSTEIHAFPEEHAVDVTFRVEPGVACRFGEVRIDGAEHVPEKLIRDELEMQPGRPFKASDLSETRRNLFALGAFSVVKVNPVREPDSESVVPVQVDLSESKFRRLRLGGGIGVESGKSDAHVSVGFEHVNVAERLIELDLDTEVGAAAIARYDEVLLGEGVTSWSPVVDSAVGLTFPRFFGPGWVMRQQLAYEMDLESDYTFYQPSWEPSVAYTFRPRRGTRRELGELTLTSAYKLSYFDFIDQTVDLSTVESTRLGLDLSAPYFLSYAEEAVVWDLRNDPIFTTRGSYVAAALGMAGGFGERGAPLFGQYDFVKAYGDLRSFLSLAPLLRMESGLTLALRAAGGFAQPVGDGDRASVPYAERYRIGGGSTVRGWPTDHLGPRICVSSYEGTERGTDDDGDGLFQVGDASYHTIGADSESCAEPIPIGGQVYGLGSVELRKPLIWDMGVTGFLDLGMAWADWAAMKEQWPLPSLGAGFRYKSPVGPVRLDFAWRLVDDPDWHDDDYDRRWNIHFSLSEAF